MSDGWQTVERKKRKEKEPTWTVDQAIPEGPPEIDPHLLKDRKERFDRGDLSDDIVEATYRHPDFIAPDSNRKSPDASCFIHAKRHPVRTNYYVFLYITRSSSPWKITSGHIIEEKRANKFKPRKDE